MMIKQRVGCKSELPPTTSLSPTGPSYLYIHVCSTSHLPQKRTGHMRPSSPACTPQNICLRPQIKIYAIPKYESWVGAKWVDPIKGVARSIIAMASMFSVETISLPLSMRLYVHICMYSLSHRPQKRTGHMLWGQQPSAFPSLDLGFASLGLAAWLIPAMGALVH